MNRILTTLSLSTALIVIATSSVFAQSMAPSSPMPGSMMKPQCSSGDPVVMVNAKNKTYWMADKSHMMMRQSDTMHQSGTMPKAMMMKRNMSMMCKSKADAMGAHMMKGSTKGSM